MKIGPVDPEIALLNLKKRKKLTQAKYIALLASLPSGLNNIAEDPHVETGPMEFILYWLDALWAVRTRSSVPIHSLLASQRAR